MRFNPKRIDGREVAAAAGRQSKGENGDTGSSGASGAAGLQARRGSGTDGSIQKPPSAVVRSVGQRPVSAGRCRAAVGPLSARASIRPAGTCPVPKRRTASAQSPCRSVPVAAFLSQRPRGGVQPSRSSRRGLSRSRRFRWVRARHRPATSLWVLRQRPGRAHGERCARSRFRGACGRAPTGRGWQ